MKFMTMMSDYNMNMLSILWIIGVLAIPGFTIMQVAKWLGFPPLVMMEEIFLGEDDE